MSRLRLLDLDRDADLCCPPGPTEVVVGLARLPLTGARLAAAEALDCTLVEAEQGVQAAVSVPDLEAAAAQLLDAVERNPLAAVTLCGLLRVNAALPVRGGLVAESLAYSMLLAGPEFARWRASRPIRPIPEPAASAVLLEREGDELVVTLNRPERRNAFGVPVRDGLVEAFELARLDESITAVLLRGNGPSFCSGGDLDEFGTTPDVATAHLIRLDRSVARRIDAVRGKVRVHLHGECIGAGIELPSFAGSVVATSDTVIALPELAMGLVPGAGGTVGIARRIGRWRTAYLALSGVSLDAATALEWRLVDGLI